MKTLIIVCLLSITAVVLARPKEYYSENYDINLDEVLGNRRLLIPYLKCVLEQGKCSAAGKDLRDHIKDAMVTDCEKCTEKQKKGTKRVLKHLIINEKDYWEQLKAKYDPEAKYSPKYEKFALEK